ncbi:hypothetical protein ACP70R_010040 [Stipagrostis hirtigluma subsp. patula]
MAGGDTGGAEPMTDYEKQRLLRIRENEARLEALGIRSLAASPLLRSPSPAAAAAKRKQKKRSADEDDEYVPSDEGGGGEEDESSSESGRDDEVDGESKSSSRSRTKGKKKLLKSGKSSKSTPRKKSASFTDFADDDAALEQAIALSLVGSSEKSVTNAETSSTGKENEGALQKKNGKASIQDSAKNRKIKKLGKSRIQLTEDDVVAFFFSFDEVGKGYITPWDLERMATINDFIWTDSEISNMIRCFDSDRDGKINLEDFRSIICRCNMLQDPEK